MNYSDDMGSVFLHLDLDQPVSGYGGMIVAVFSKAVTRLFIINARISCLVCHVMRVPIHFVKLTLELAQVDQPMVANDPVGRGKEFREKV